MFGKRAKEKNTLYQDTLKATTIKMVYRLYYFGAPKSLQMVTAAMKLKDACSLEEKL